MYLTNLVLNRFLVAVYSSKAERVTVVSYGRIEC